MSNSTQVRQLLTDNFTFQAALMRNAYVLPIAPAAYSGICTRCINSMFATLNNFDYIGSQKLLADVGNLGFDSFSGNTVSNKDNLAVVSGYTEAAICNFVYQQFDYVADFYDDSFSHCWLPS
jgi:hypothetical protein